MTRDAISRLLYREWDPIGTRGSAPVDEYDDTAAAVTAILAHAGSREDIARCLALARTVAMKLPPNPAADERAAGLILAIASTL